MAGGWRHGLAAGVGLAAALALVPATAAAVPGQLTQLSGEDGCWSDNGNATAGNDICHDGESIEDPLDVTVSPDGRNVYVAALQAVLIFSRNTSTGALTQLGGTAGCVENQGYAGNCVEGRGVNGVRGVAVSPDGKHVYVASFNDDAIAAFSRSSSTGALTQLSGTDGCIQETGAEGCADGKALDTLRGVSVSPDGKSVYAANEFDEAVVVLARNADSGALTQLADPNGCVSDTGQSDGADATTAGQCVDADGRLGDPFWTAVSPDSKNVYLASDGDFIVNLQRNTSSGALTQPAGTAGCVSETAAAGCADGTGLQDPRSAEVSPDGDNVYAGSIASESVTAFSRNSDSGALSQLSGTDACVNDDGDEGCADGRAMGEAWGVAVAPDGDNVYLAADDGNAVVAFSRAANGALTQLSGEAGCVQDEPSAMSQNVGCTPGKGLADADEVAVSPDCRSVYVASENDNAVAIFSREAAACPSQAEPPVEDGAPTDSVPTGRDEEQEDAGFDDRDCSDFSNQAEAQDFFEREGGPDEDPHRLDADDDGVACEAEAAPARGEAGRGGGRLPFTGLGLVLVALAGAVMLAAGVVIRLGARRR